MEELKEAIKNKNIENIEEELGDTIFTLINLSISLKTNYENCLISANKKFLKRFSLIEKYAGDKINQQTPEDFKKLWEKAKNNL